MIMTAIKNKLSLNATTLKILAIVLMALDHVHQMWEYTGAPMWLKWLGRPVFPIFLFVMAESFHYTRNRKNLLKRLLFAAWIMSICNNLLQFALPNEHIALINNAFMTFFVVGLYMLFYDMFVDGIKTKKPGKIIGALLLCFVPILTMLPLLWTVSFASNDAVPQLVIQVLLIIGSMIPNILFLEGGPAIVALGLLFYILRKWRLAQIAVLTIYSVAMFVLSGGESIQWIAIFAIFPMLLYDGEKGRGMKHLFYIFYPMHIYLFYIISTLWARF